MSSWLDSLFAGGGAPADASYVLVAADDTLTEERVVGAASGQLTLSDGGAGGSVTLGLATTDATPGAYVRANVTVDAYGRVTAAESGPWVALTAGEDYDSTPPGALTITMLADLRGRIRPGDPIRWLTSVPVLEGNTIIL